MELQFRQEHDRPCCPGCTLHPQETGNFTWFTPTEVDGPVDIYFAFEAPGEQEDRYVDQFTKTRGRPVVGPAGQMHRSCMQDAGIFGNYALGNVCKCRPMHNKTPTSAQVNQCVPYMLEEIQRLQPKVVVCCGGTAIKALMPEIAGHGVLKSLGRIVERDGVTYIANFHPSFINRQQDEKSRAYRKEQYTNVLKTATKIVKDDPTADWLKPGFYFYADTVDKVKSVVDMYLTEPAVEGILAFDTETMDGLNRFTNRVSVLQFCHDGEMTVLIPFQHPEAPWTPDEIEQIKAEIVRLFTTPAETFQWIVGNYLKFDLAMLRTCIHPDLGTARLPIHASLLDTMFLAHAVDEQRLKRIPKHEKPMSLERIARDFIGWTGFEDNGLKKERDEFGKKSLFDEAFREYCAMDGYVPHRTARALLALADQEGGGRERVLRFNKHLHGPLICVFEAIERNGFCVDVEHLRYLCGPQSPIKTRMTEIQAELKTLPEVQKANEVHLQKTKAAGMTTLFGPPWVLDIDKKDCQLTLFIDVLGLEPLGFGKPKIGPRGEEIPQPKIDTFFFERYRSSDDLPDDEEITPTQHIIDLVYEYKGLYKLDTSYTKSVFGRIHNEGPNGECVDGRMRSSFTSCRVTSGRTSSEGVNLQQVPSCILLKSLSNWVQTSRGLIRFGDLVQQRVTATVPYGGLILDHFKYTVPTTIRVSSRHPKGYELEGTPQHRIKVLTSDFQLVDKRLDEISEDDCLVIAPGGAEAVTAPVVLPPFEGLSSKPQHIKHVPQYMTEELARFLGYILTEGGYANTNTVLTFSNQDRSLVDDYVSCFEACFGRPPQHIATVPKERDGCYYVEHYDVSLIAFLKHLGLETVTAQHKKVPNCVLQAPRNILLHFIAAAIEGDGNIRKRIIKLHTASEEMVHQFQAICHSLGYVTGRAVEAPGKRSKLPTHLVVLHGQDAEKLTAELPIVREQHRASHERKKEFGRVIPHLKPWLLRQPKVVTDRAKKASTRPKCLHARALTVAPNFTNANLERNSTLLDYLDGLDSARGTLARRFVSEELVALPIDKIEEQQHSEGVEVVDMETENSYYVVGGLYSHNSKGRIAATNAARKAVKNMYCVSNGRLLIQMDVRQSEIRWVVQLAQDLNYAKVFHNMGKIEAEFIANPNPENKQRVKEECDVHRQTAALMNQIPIEDVTPLQRQEAKRIVFGMLYGQHITTLAKNLGIEVEKAQELQDIFFSKFPKVKDWLDWAISYARANGFVDSPMGRRRHLAWAYAADDRAQARRADRQAMNSPIQVISSDYNLLAGIRLQRYIEENNLDWRIVNLVHDSIIADIPYDEAVLREYIETAERIFTDTSCLQEMFGIEMIVPLAVDFDIGFKYGDCKGFDRSEKNFQEIWAWLEAQVAAGTAWPKAATKVWN
jgi:uracil-DNA glycosylase family 4